MTRKGKTPSGTLNDPSPGPRAVVLVAGGFDEQAAARLMSQLRRSGQSVAMVSTAAGLIRGEHGLAVRPDYSLESLPTLDHIQLVSVPGSRRSAMALLADPRVHRLFEQVLARDGRLAILSGADAAFAETGHLELLADQHSWLQGREEFEAVIERMLDYLAAWEPVKE